MSDMDARRIEETDRRHPAAVIVQTSVKLSELRRHLPQNTPDISIEDRRRTVERRRPAILNLYRG